MPPRRGRPRRQGKRTWGPELGVELVGGRELRASLKRAGLDLEDLKAAHAEAAQIVRNRAAELAPARSGRLRDTIRGSGTKTAAWVRAGRKSVPYAGPIHWGWPSRNIAANPFLVRAMEESRGEWTGRYMAELEHIIHRIEGA